MNNPLRTSEDYEYYIYSLKNSSKYIKQSSLIFIRRGVSLAKVEGELIFKNGYRIVIRERIIFDRLPAIIDWYGYEIWNRDKKLYWYDSQPHPKDTNLKSTHPHHKHIPPDIKHNRIPAPKMNFIQPNLNYLISEIEGLIKE